MSASAKVEPLPVPPTPAVLVQDLVYSWPGQAPVLDIPSLRIDPGETVFMLGPSGSGKSTLLGLIGGVLDAGSGKLHVLDTPLHETPVARRDRFRADHIGFIFQLFNLLPYLSVIDNVVLPCRFSKRRYELAVRRSSTIEQEAARLLDHLGVAGELLQRQVGELSIGQQQRVAAARALIGEPELLIADEPTSALDHDLRMRFIELLLGECAATRSAVLFVSHDTSLSSSFDRSLLLPKINRAGDARD